MFAFIYLRGRLTCGFTRALNNVLDMLNISANDAQVQCSWWCDQQNDRCCHPPSVPRVSAFIDDRL